jgi:hypothetical protein
MYDFDETGLDLFDFDIRNCFNDAPSKMLAFKLPGRHLKNWKKNDAERI